MFKDIKTMILVNSRLVSRNVIHFPTHFFMIFVGKKNDLFIRHSCQITGNYLSGNLLTFEFNYDNYLHKGVLEIPLSPITYTS